MSSTRCSSPSRALGKSLNLKFQSHEPADTLCFAACLGNSLGPGSVIFLKGEMGAGKTLFARGLYEGLDGEDPDQVMSPTYTLVNIYEQARLPISHADLYRLINREQLLGMEFEDILWNPQGVCIVEWPELAEGLLPADDILEVTLAVCPDREKRDITISTPGDRYVEVFRALEARS